MIKKLVFFLLMVAGLSFSTFANDVDCTVEVDSTSSCVAFAHTAQNIINASSGSLANFTVVSQAAVFGGLEIVVEDIIDGNLVMVKCKITADATKYYIVVDDIIDGNLYAPSDIFVTAQFIVIIESVS